MPPLRDYEFATLAAEKFIANRGITMLPVDPFAIAAKLGILVEPKPTTAAGVSGMLLKNVDSFGILYATNLANEGFQRFSVGHELGHYCLPGHPERLFGNGQGVHESRSGFVSGDRCELEADHYAAGLLMPRSLFLPIMRKAGRGLAAIETLAGRCKTSLTATAIRYAQVTDDPVAVVVSTGQVVDYCFLSDALKEARGLTWISKREPVPQRTVTYHFNRNSQNILQAQRKEGSSACDEWFGGGPNIEFDEEVVGLGTYGKTLTVLSTDADLDPDDEDEEAEEDESWTPRFRR